MTYLPDVVEGAFAEKNDKIVFDNNFIIIPVTLKRIYLLRKLVISKKSLYEAIHHCIHCKKTFKERQKNYLIKVVRVDVDVYSRYFSQISGDKIRSKKNTKIKTRLYLQYTVK